MPSYPVFIRGASSVKDPCPDGTALSYQSFNDTIFVICDAAFLNSSREVDLGLALGLGLGLGLGLPLLCLFCRLFIVPWADRDSVMCCWKRCNQN